ncbi:glycosyltransferase family 2 protein [Ideonella dechloratans]|uniref:glycosyltransferase family 2 protein n=1 Tax=Ideonella dechloratans TaxID=36863 RepID=UPI0035B2E27F
MNDKYQPLKISVITAVFNRVQTIGQALSSVQTQTWPHVEHLVIDGASTDGTIDILEAQKNRISVLISEKDSGIYFALNKGLEHATGDVVGLMHSDDFFADNRVLEKVAAAFSDPMVDGVYADLDYVVKENPDKVIRHWHSGTYSRRKLALGWMPPHPTLFLRSSVIKQWGGYDTSFRIAADYDSILRYLGKGNIQLAYIPEVFVKMRVGGESNRSLSRIIRKSWEDYRALRQNGVGGLAALFWKNFSKVGQFFRAARVNSSSAK